MIYGIILSLNAKLVNRANQDFTGRKYKDKEGKGMEYERFWRDLALLLDIKDCWMSLETSALDEFLKVDLVIEKEDPDIPETCLVFQIKSSKAGAEKHQDLQTVSYKAKTYAVPPCLVADKPPVELLKELSDFTGISLRDSTIAAIELSQNLKGKSLPKSAFKNPVIHALRVLNLVKEQGNTLLF